MERIRVAELAEDMFREYRINGRKTLKFVEWRWEKHLKQTFGPMRATEVTTDAVNKYVDNRHQQKAENATINRELSSTPRKVYQVPAFPRLRENAPRKGFVEENQYRQLCEKCPEGWLRAMLALAYNFGFRKAQFESPGILRA